MHRAPHFTNHSTQAISLVLVVVLVLDFVPKGESLDIVPSVPYSDCGSVVPWHPWKIENEHESDWQIEEMEVVPGEKAAFGDCISGSIR
jgi:hypothetical protein